MYTLKALDPEGSGIIYGVISDYFSVDKENGNVTLIKKLDREVFHVILSNCILRTLCLSHEMK